VVTGEPTYDRGEGTDALGSSKFDERFYGPRVITFKDPQSTIAAIDAAEAGPHRQRRTPHRADTLGAGVCTRRLPAFTGASRAMWKGQFRARAVASSPVWHHGSLVHRTSASAAPMGSMPGRTKKPSSAPTKMPMPAIGPIQRSAAARGVEICGVWDAIHSGTSKES
jgi:hypothetical protein